MKRPRVLVVDDEPDPGNPRYILTQPGVGYCFVAPP